MNIYQEEMNEMVNENGSEYGVRRASVNPLHVEAARANLMRDGYDEDVLNLAHSYMMNNFETYGTLAYMFGYEETLVDIMKQTGLVSYEIGEF